MYQQTHKKTLPVRKRNLKFDKKHIESFILIYINILILIWILVDLISQILYLEDALKNRELNFHIMNHNVFKNKLSFLKLCKTVKRVKRFQSAKI